MNMRSMSHARMSFSCRDGRWVPMGASGCVGSGGVERRMHSTYAFRSLVRVPACGYFWLLLHDRVCCWLRLVVLAFGFSCFRLLCTAGGSGGVYYYVLFILQHTYPISYVYMLFCYMPTIEYI